MNVIVGKPPWKSPARKTEQVAVGTTVPTTCILSAYRRETCKFMKRKAFLHKHYASDSPDKPGEEAFHTPKTPEGRGGIRWDHGPNLSGNRVEKEISVFSGQKKGAAEGPFIRVYGII
jgi:hypothetical protein